MIEFLKMLLFVEIIAIIICLIMHFALYSKNDGFPIRIYIEMVSIVFVAFLLTIFIIIPIYNWIFN